MKKRVLFVVPLFVIGGLASACTPTPSAPKPKPSPPALPSIVGTPSVGTTLTATTGNWLYSPTSFNYSWQRCTDIVATSCVQVATTSAYTLVPADEGSWIFVGVTGVNGAGTGGSMSSSGVGPVTP